MVTLLLALTLACGGTAPEQAAPASPASTAQPASAAPAPTPVAELGEGTMNVHALHQRMGSQTALILDVRTPGEFAQGHVAGAVNIPLQELKARQAEVQPYKDQEIAVICAVGGRSATAARYLKTEGYDQVYNVLGGTRDWVSAGYPVE